MNSSKTKQINKIEVLENLSNNIDTHLPKLNKSQLISILTLFGISTEGKPNVICNKRKLMRWIQKGYEDIMRGEERDLEAKVKHLHYYLLFIIFTFNHNRKRFF